MVISEKYAKKLEKSGMATVQGGVRHEGAVYAIVYRYDLCRADHVRINESRPSAWERRAVALMEAMEAEM